MAEHCYPVDESRTIPVEQVDIVLPSHIRNDRFLCYAKFILGGAIKVKGVKVVRAKDGRITVCMPDQAERNRNCPRCDSFIAGAYRYCPQCGMRQIHNPELWSFTDICFPIHRAQRELVNEAVLRAYDEAIADAAKGGVPCRA